MLTVPVKKGINKKISQIEISYQIPWQKKLLKTISQRYAKEKFFEKVFLEFACIINSSPVYLSDLNKNLLLWAVERLKIPTRIEVSSELNVRGKSTEKLINLCHSVNGTKYFSGQGGKAYLDVKKFESQNIELEYSDFSSKHFYQKTFCTDKNLFTNSIIETLFKYEATEIWR